MKEQNSKEGEEAGVIRKHEEEYAHEERERELAGKKAAEENVGWLERIGLRRRRNRGAENAEA